MSLYRILGVDIDASFEDIRKGYLNATKETHPDKNISNTQTPHTDSDLKFQFLRIQKAWEVKIRIVFRFRTNQNRS